MWIQTLDTSILSLFRSSGAWLPLCYASREWDFSDTREFQSFLEFGSLTKLNASINMLLVKEYSPRPSLLGSTNALVQFFICLSRAVSPAFIRFVPSLPNIDVSCFWLEILFSFSFATSADLKIFGGYSWVVIMVVICIASCSLSKGIVTETDRLR